MSNAISVSGIVRCGSWISSGWRRCRSPQGPGTMTWSPDPAFALQSRVTLAAAYVCVGRWELPQGLGTGHPLDDDAGTGARARRDRDPTAVTAPRHRP